MTQRVSNMSAELGNVWGYSLVAYFKLWLQEYKLYLCQQNHRLCPLTFWTRNYFFFSFNTPCIENVNNTGTKYDRIMKQTAF